ncbi:hypothetical protein BDFB_014892, partial [Asbolus verrucosus]
EIALKTASLWYSWDNIPEEYRNNEIKYRKFEESPHEGSQLMDDGHKQNEIRKDGIEQDWKIIIEIDFSHGKIHELLGFDKKIYKEGINYATKIGNITKDIDQILIHCSLVSSSYQNNLK